jgi:uncharacterized protein (DUF433 family)
MDHQTRIVTAPKIMLGKPVIKGTRITVEFILELLANKWTEQEILRNYPGLTYEDIVACQKYSKSNQKSVCKA